MPQGAENEGPSLGMGGRLLALFGNESHLIAFT